jgi:hypothetical protein
MMSGLIAALSLVVLGGTAGDESRAELGVGQQRPWTEGVTPEQQRAADALFQAGNELVDNSVFAKAAEKYREALRLWDHPAIHYNLGLALVNLKEPRAVHEHLSAALRYGKGPLDQEKVNRAKDYLKLVEQQLTYVEITCDLPGVIVGMDGRRLFEAPGRFARWVDPGPHVFNVSQEGFPSNDRSRILVAGDKITLHISQMYTEEELTQYNRRWSAWKPWVVLGAGVALAAGGGLLHLEARDTYRDLDTRAAGCGVRGCEPDPELARLRSRGDVMQKMAAGSYAAGGALFATGVVLAFINRPQIQQLTPDEYEQQGVKLSLQMTSGGSGVLATFRF